MRTVMLRVVGLGCECCPDELANRWRTLQGAESVEIDVNAGTARIRYNEDCCTPMDLIATARRAGCHVEVEGFASDAVSRQA